MMRNKPCSEWRQVRNQYEYTDYNDPDEEILEMDADMIEYKLEGEDKYKYECKIRKGDDEVFKTRDFKKFADWLVKEADITPTLMYEDVVSHYDYKDPNQQMATVSFD